MTLLDLLKSARVENVKEGEFEHEVEPPYICYLESNPKTISADGKVVYKQENYGVELYVEKSDKEKVCKNIENVFSEHKITYEKAVVWIGSDQQLYEVIYIIPKKEEY